MNPDNIKELAISLMQQHGLHEWKFFFDGAKKRAGQCDYRNKVISLSIYYVSNNAIEEIKNTILHEIAHALAGHSAGHGPGWIYYCNKIGARPERCYDSTKVVMPKGKYKAICGGCQKVFHKHRVRNLGENRYRYCAACGPQAGRLDYKIY